MPDITIGETYQKWRQRMKDHGTGDLPFCIAFCGVFSAGKTSIINRLLHCDLPTGINPITKVVTRIRYGERTAYSFIVGGQKRALPPEHLKDVITGKRTVPDGCSEILIELPSAFLKQNVEIIDTPGYEDTRALEDMTRTAVLTADLILFCVNALAFGNQFEKEYLRELEQSHGNFCMVVNRVDSLNTEEDFECLRTEAQRLMRGRGNASQGTNADGRYFFTIAAGAYATLNGLDTFLTELTQTPAKRKTIRDSTNRCFTAYHRELLSHALQGEIEENEALLAERMTEDAASLRRLRVAHQLRESELKKKQEDYTYYVDVLLNNLKRSLTEQFARLTSPRTFSADATAALYEQLRPVQSKIAHYAHILGMEEGQAAQLLTLGTVLKIPAPIAEEKVTRNTSERVVTTLGKWLAGDFTIDDGRSYVWQDYQKPANQYVQAQVIEPLRERWQLIRQRLMDALSESAPAAGDFSAEITQLEDHLRVMRATYRSYFARMTPEDMSTPCADASARLARMLTLVREYRSLVEQLSMPGAFVRMLSEHADALETLQKAANRKQTDDPQEEERLEATFVSMCRAYVTLGERPHNPAGADQLLDQMKEYLETVHACILCRGALDEQKIRQNAEKD